MGEQDEGELAILVSNGWVRLVQKGDTVEFAPIHIEIEYTLNLGGEITEGIVFRRESQNEVSHQCVHGASSWLIGRSHTCSSLQHLMSLREYGRHVSIACGNDVLGSWNSLSHTLFPTESIYPHSL